VTFHNYLMCILVDLEKEQKLASPGLEVKFSQVFPFTDNFS